MIHAARLDLSPMPLIMMRSIQDGNWPGVGRLLGTEIPAEWRDGDWQWLDQRVARAEADSAELAWAPHVLLLRQAPGSGGPGRVVVGDAGFHGSPDENGRVEVGYMVLSAYRRQGLAEEAVRALLDWAVAEQQVTRFQACINTDNIASLNLIRKVGFSQVGSQRHERRGAELIFHLDQP
ncbi:MAG TPA: GNAT family N-acetyltransferase [Streptosporangiaceae bacterium]|jgi:RimJ/RimL family protein N-acetyltransferase|nr:GNAT family N-acetyltransferase [Streptosporangiaceae bacterium]